MGRILSDAEIEDLESQDGKVVDPASTCVNPLKETTASTPTASTWSSIVSFKGGRARDLHFCKQPSTAPDHHIECDDEDSTAAIQKWGNSLVGYFIGNTPPTQDIKLSLEKAWRIRNLEIIPMAEGFFLFNFSAYDIGQQILDDGPWFVYGHPLILKRWIADISLNRQNLETIPIWVRIPNLNLCFRSNSALSMIGSALGKPICMDHATALGTRYAFARICVEVDVDAELPSELRMKYKDKTIFQKVEYAWKPNPCKTCRTFDHGDKACPLKVDTSRPKKIWVAKNSSESTAQVHQEVEQHQNNSKRMTTHTAEKEVKWNTVKGKKPSEKVTSPNKLSSSPKPRSSSGTHIDQNSSNRFISLSNLEGDSNAPTTEIASTTALALGETVITKSQSLSEEPADANASLSSIHHLDKSILAKLP